MPCPRSELFLQPHAGAAAILGDELDAGRFKRSANCLQRGVARLGRGGFKLANGDDSDARGLGQILL